MPRFRVRLRRKPKGVSQKVKAFVKKEIKKAPELCAFDTAISINPATAGAIQKITSVAQGDDINNRQGDSINALSQQLRLALETTTAGTGAYTPNYNSIVRIIMFQDMYGGSTPTVSGTTNTSLLAAASINANFNIDCVKRYRILYDRQHQVAQLPLINTGLANAHVGFVDNPGTKLIRIKKKLRNTMDFADTTGTLAAKGQVYIFTITHALATSQVMTLSGYSRLYFREK